MILIIEDDPVSLMVIRYIILKFKTLYKELINVKSAMELIESDKSIKLVIISLSLCDVNGINFIKWMKKNKKPQSIIVITSSIPNKINTYT